MPLASTCVEPAGAPLGAPQDSSPHASYLLLAAALLLVLFGLATGSALHHSPVVTEGSFVARGWAFGRAGRLLPATQPPLALLAGMGVLLEPGLPHPAELPGWEPPDAARLSQALLWQSGVVVDRALFLARLPTIWLALLLGAVVWRWARELYGWWAAVLALTLYASSPNVLAFAGLATPDLGTAALYIAALYTWGRLLISGRRRWFLLAALLLGLSLSISFVSLVLVPTFLLMALWAAGRRGRLWAGLRAFLVAVVAAGLILLAVYFAMAHQGFPTLYGQALTRFQRDLPGDGPVYLFGRVVPAGQWYGPLVVLAAKLPLPTWLLFAFALVLAAVRRTLRQEWALFIPALLYLIVVSVIPSRPEMRLLLPLLLLMLLFSSRLVNGPLRSGWVRPALASALGVMLLLTSARAYPDYPAFLNGVVRELEDGSPVLVGSNLDWGQDLPGLAAYVRERGIEPLYLSYHGGGDPAYYGIDYLALPSRNWALRSAPQAAYYPLNPAPGVYAISVTNLAGEAPGLRDAFGYFRTREPLTKIGGSLYLYEVFPEVLPESERDVPWFAQCADGAPPETRERLVALTGVRDLHVFEFDCRQSLAIPDGPGWLLLPAGVEPAADLGPADYVARHDDGSPRYRVWMVQAPPPVPPSTVEFPAVPLPVPIAGYVELLGYQVSAGSVSQGETLVLTGWWRVREPPPLPVAVAAQLAAPDGTGVIAADGMGVAVSDWRPGMVIIQQHFLVASADAPPGEYTLSVALYSPATGERFALFESSERVVDRIVLRGVQVVERR